MQVQLYYVRSKKLYLPTCFPQSEKNDKLEYFIKGEGYKKTKAFDIVEAEIPDQMDNIYNIAQVQEQYGDEVALEYMKTRTCELIKPRLLFCIKNMVKKRNITFEEAQLLQQTELEAIDIFDTMMTIFGIYLIDNQYIQKKLIRLFPDYNPFECTYKDQSNVSTRDMIAIAWGEPTAKVFEKLAKKPSEWT